MKLTECGIGETARVVAVTGCTLALGRGMAARIIVERNFDEKIN
jgi:Fe2+ transport system protein FeoA